MVKTKKITLITFIIFNLLIAVNIAYAVDAQITGNADDTGGIWLFSAGLSAGTQAAPTGTPGGAPTDDIIDDAIAAGVLEYIGDETDEVLGFAAGPPEPYENGRDTTIGGVVEGLTTIDDFGFIEEGADPESNYDAGIGGWVSLGNFGLIRPDGIIATGVLGNNPSVGPEEDLQGFEIFIYEDAELSGFNCTIFTLNGAQIDFVIEDRQINPNTTAGADDTLIAIDLDTLAGFSANDAVISIRITDDAISMIGEPQAGDTPIWGDSTLELDAVATLASVLRGEISGYKWNDIDGDGVKDVGEPPLSGWTIQLSGDATNSTTTDSDGYYSFTELLEGSYGVSEVLQSGWVQTYPPGGSHSISLSPGENSTDNNFGNKRPVGSISGVKWHDVDGDGVKDVGEPGLEGWQITLSGDASSSTITGPDGSYIFEDLFEGNYQVFETLKLGWVRTFPPGSGIHAIALPPGGTSTDNDFGNVEAPPSIGGDAETILVNDGKEYNSSIALIAFLAAASVLLIKTKYQ